MRFLEVTLESVRCSFQRKHWRRLDHIYLAKTAKSTNDLSHTAFSFKLDGVLVCKHRSWMNPSYVLADKIKNFVLGTHILPIIICHLRDEGGNDIF